MTRTEVFGFGDAQTRLVGLVLFNCLTNDLVHLVSDNLANTLFGKSTIMSFNSELATQRAQG